MDNAGFVLFGTQEEAETYLHNLPDNYSGRTGKTESGKWSVSFRKQKSDWDRIDATTGIPYAVDRE